MVNIDLTAKQNEKYRNELVERVDLLEKVKKLIMMDGIELATTQQVADFFEVPVDNIKMNKQNHKHEFEADGLRVWSLSELKDVVSVPKVTGKLPLSSKVNGDLPLNPKLNGNLVLGDGTTITVPNRGLLLWPKRAINRMGMVLRGSKVAEEVRTQLLNVLDEATNEQRTAAADKEIDLLKAQLNDMTKQIAALTEFMTRNQKQLDDETIVRELSKTDSLLNRLRDGKHTIRHAIWATVNQATGKDQTKSRTIFHAATDKFKERTGKDLRSRAYQTYKSTGCRPTIIGTLGGEEEASIYLDCAVEAIAEAGLLINEAAVMDMMDKRK